MDENDVMVPGTDATDPHSCRMMSTMVADPRFAVRYTPRDRSYAFEERGDPAPATCGSCSGSTSVRGAASGFRRI